MTDTAKNAVISSNLLVWKFGEITVFSAVDTIKIVTSIDKNVISFYG